MARRASSKAHAFNISRSHPPPSMTNGSGTRMSRSQWIKKGPLQSLYTQNCQGIKADIDLELLGRQSPAEKMHLLLVRKRLGEQHWRISSLEIGISLALAHRSSMAEGHVALALSSVAQPTPHGLRSVNRCGQSLVVSLQFGSR